MDNNVNVPQKNNSNGTLKIILLILGIFVGIGLCMGCLVILASIFGLFTIGKTAEVFSGIVEEAMQQEQKTKEEEEKSWQNPESQYFPVTLNNFKWEVTSVERIGTSIYPEKLTTPVCYASAEHEFLLVEVRVSNGSDVDETLTYPNIYDSNRILYLPDNYGQDCIGEGFLTGQTVKAGDNKLMRMVFDVPKSSKGFRLKVYEDVSFSTVVKYIKLDI